MSGADELAPSSRFHATLQACASREISPEVALLKLAMAASSAAQLEAIIGEALSAARGSGLRSAVSRLTMLQELSRSQPLAWHTVRSLLEVVRHDEAPGGSSSARERVSRVASAFDRAARLSPEASVALYSLGDPLRLAIATAEVVDIMRAWQLLGRERALLDIGCGVGRMEQALAPEVGFITGIDVSPVMLELARQRCASRTNVDFRLADGQNLERFATSSVDGVLAVDCFPYLVQCGMQLAERHITDAARVLKPGGYLLLFNFSYRGDLDADRRDVQQLAEAAGLRVLRNGIQALETWDGAAFHLVKAASAGAV